MLTGMMKATPCAGTLVVETGFFFFANCLLRAHLTCTGHGRGGTRNPQPARGVDLRGRGEVISSLIRML